MSTITQPQTQTPQQVFDRLYITTGEIISSMGVSRTAVAAARKRGALPDAIVVGDNRTCIWARDNVKPHLDKWQEQLLKKDTTNDNTGE